MKMKLVQRWMMYILTGWDNMRRELVKLIQNPIIIFIITSFFLCSFIQNIFVLEDQNTIMYDEVIDKINDDFKNDIIYAGMDIRTLNDYIDNLSIQYSSSYIYDYVYDMLNEKLLLYTADLDSEEISLKNKMNSDLYKSDHDQKSLNKELKIITYKKNINVSFTNDILYISILNDQMIMSLLSILTGIIISYYLLIYDQDKNMLPLYSSTKRGIRKIFKDKLYVLCLMMILIYAIKFCLEYICLLKTHFDFQIPIQMIYEHSNSDICMNALHYLLFIEFMHLCVAMVFISLFLMLYQAKRNITGSLMIFSGLILIEYLMFHFISLVSQYAFLKKYNLFYIIGIGSNHIFDYQLDTLVYILTGIILLSCILMNLFQYSYCRFKNQGKIIRTGIKLKTNHLYLYQLTDIFVLKKYALVLLIILGYSFYDYKTYTTVKSYDTLMTENLRYEYLGKITSGKLKRLEEEKHKMDNARNELDTLNKKIWTTGLSEEEQKKLENLSIVVANQNAFETVYNEIQATYQNGGNEYLDHTGLDLLFMTDSKIYQFVLFILITIPSLLFGAIQGDNKYHSNISELVISSKSKTKYNKQLILNAVFNSIILIIIIYGFRYFKITKYYSINIVSSSTNNYFAIRNSMDIKTYLFLSFLNITLLFASLELFAVLLTKKLPLINSFLISLIISCILYFLPVGIHFIVCIGTSSFNTILLSGMMIIIFIYFSVMICITDP